MIHRHATLSLVLGLLAVVIFGGSLPATRIAVAAFDPWFVTAGRATVAGLVALGLIALRRPRFPAGQTATLALIALLLVIGFPAAIALGSRTVPAAHGGVILGLLPLATTVAAVPLARERPSLAFWILSLVGAGLVIAFALRDGDTDLVIGDLYLGLAVILTGIGYTLSGVMARSLPGWQVIAWALILCLPIGLLATIVLWPANAAMAPLSAWLGILYGGVMTQFVAYALWNAALAGGGVARIGQLQLLQPFVTFLIAGLLLGERIDHTMIAFAVAVAVVVALGRKAAVTTRPATG